MSSPGRAAGPSRERPIARRAAIDRALDRGDADEAVRGSLARSAAGPSSPRAATRVGDLLLARGERAPALDHYFLALRANPLFRDARMGLSLGYYEAGDLDESVLQLRNVLQLRPDDPRRLSSRAVVHLRWGNLEYAEQSLEEGLAVDPHHPQGWNNLGIVRQRQGAAAAALACFQRAVAIKADFATAHANLGLALREAERLDEARAHLERATRPPPDERGRAREPRHAARRPRRPGRRRARIGRALELDPRHAEATHGLGLVAFRQLDIAGARTRFLEALALRPDYAAARTSLGELELALGEFATGWANYESRLDTAGAPRLALALARVGRGAARRTTRSSSTGSRAWAT